MFYIYELWDPRTNRKFFVGRGQGDRAYQHQREVVSGQASDCEKTRTIRGILDSGLQVEVRIIAEYAAEDDALDHEFSLIGVDPSLTVRARRGRLRSLLSNLERVQKRRPSSSASSRIAKVRAMLACADADVRQLRQLVA